jgi:S-adenosylhomocysteine hydrolase
MPKTKGRKGRQLPIPTRQPAALPFPMAPGSLAQGSFQIGLGYDPTGKMEPKDIVNAKEGWSEYTLDDGSVIRVKGVLLDIKRALNQFNAEGDPVYVMQLALVHQLRAPDQLKKDYKAEE